MMKISKKDALCWFEFFAMLPEDQDLVVRQQELVYAVFAQLEAAVQARREVLQKDIAHLKSLDGRTLYVGKDEAFPSGCRSCLTGTGLTAIRKTNKCNLNCPFCYNYGEMNRIAPVGEGLWEIGGTKYYERDIDLLLKVYPKPTGISYVYLEPFMEIELYYGIISRFAKAGIHQHLYTNGTLATQESLQALGEAGLNELRFNLGASNCSDRVIENIALAKRYIPKVGIETPMTPEYYEAFQNKKTRILSTGVDFMNCAELHLNANNLCNYMGENLYMTRLGYVSPIWSRELTLKLMAQADREGWEVLVHDCSNDTKFSRDMNLRAKEGGWFGANAYACEFARIPFEAFLPVLRDEQFLFIEEAPLPKGYNVGELFF